MQEDIKQPQKQESTTTNSVAVAPAPTPAQTPQDSVSKPVMDIKTEQPKQHVQEDPKPQQPEKKEEKLKKSKSGKSNIGVIIFALIICATLVSLAIYAKMQGSTVSN